MRYEPPASILLLIRKYQESLHTLLHILRCRQPLYFFICTLPLSLLLMAALRSRIHAPSFFLMHAHTSCI